MANEYEKHYFDKNNQSNTNKIYYTGLLNTKLWLR